jgi:hypothetical protein
MDAAAIACEARVARQFVLLFNYCVKVLPTE